MNFDLLLKYSPIVMATIALLGLILSIIIFMNENRKRKREIEVIRINISRLNIGWIGTMIENLNISVGALDGKQIQREFKRSVEENKNG